MKSGEIYAQTKFEDQEEKKTLQIVFCEGKFEDIIQKETVLALLKLARLTYRNKIASKYI